MDEALFMREPLADRGLPLSGRPIRIARVITRLNVGGPAQHVVLLAAGLDPARFSTTLLVGRVGREEGDLGGMARERGVEPLLVPSMGRPIRLHRDLHALIRLVRLFRRIRPDLVHTHTAKAGTLGRLAARFTGVPVLVHTFHGHALDGYFSAPATRLFLEIERRLARITHRILAVSPRVRESLLALGIGRPDQVEVVPLGLDLARFLACGRGGGVLRPALGIPDATPLLGSIGRLVPIKDHPTLFRAVARLQGPHAPHLVVVGDGEARPRLTQLARDLGVGERVHFLGWRSDLEAILSEVDVIVSASQNEGTPVALIEAMAAGVPVVATDVGGVGDLVQPGRTGWLAPAAAPELLAATLAKVLAGPRGWPAITGPARELVRARHSVSGLVSSMERLYERLIAEGRGAPAGGTATEEGGRKACGFS